MSPPSKSAVAADNSGVSNVERETASETLFVGNLSSDVIGPDLMHFFSRYEPLDCLISYTSRTFAFIFFRSVPEAKAAKLAFRSALFRGNRIRIDFARPAKPCKCLWVCGVSRAVTSQELEAMCRSFGRIEDFRFYRDRNTAFVEFANINEATRAVRTMNGKLFGGDSIRVDFLRIAKKDVLADYGQFQARPQHSQISMGRDGQPSNVLWVSYPPTLHIDEQALHNAMILYGEIERIESFPSRHYSLVVFRSVDEARRAKEGQSFDPRITIMYLSSELAPGRYYRDFNPGSKVPQPHGLLVEHPIQPLQLDGLSHSRPLGRHNFPGQLPQRDFVGPNVPTRPFGPRGIVSSNFEPKFAELDTHHRFSDGIRHHTIPSSGAWDVHDINKFQRDSKRSRIDGALFFNKAPFPLRKTDDRGSGQEQTFAINQVINGVHSSLNPEFDHTWRGMLAKGGSPFCHARCVPIGKGIGTALPYVVDCKARTQLSVLAEYSANAIGFDIVFFLPDSEDDFSSFTEFINYLKQNNRAGVASLVDDTNLFLVPPSDFLTKVLKVTGPDRLYGVFFKFPEVANSTPMQNSMHLPVSSTQYLHKIPPTQAEYDLISAKEGQFLPKDYNRSLHDDIKLPPKPPHQATIGPSAVHSAPPNNISASQAGVTLTPELIATITSILSATSQSSASDVAKMAVGSMTVKSPFPSFATTDGNQSLHQVANHPGHPPQHVGTNYNILGGLYQSCPPSSIPGHPAQVVCGSSYFQDTTASLQLQGAVSSRPITNGTITCQSGQLAVFSQSSQQYQAEVSSSTQKGYEAVQGTGASVLCTYRANNLFSSSSQDANPSQQQTVVPYSVGKVNSELPDQQVQPLLSAVGLGSSEVEAGKNHIYQPSLNLAANLLLQIQQGKIQGGHEPQNQQ